MLIKTITMETSDKQLFSKASPLLPAASELTFHTVNCSALNAEELRRENGIEVRDQKKFFENVLLFSNELNIKGLQEHGVCQS